jgi:hypothetical protein
MCRKLTPDARQGASFFAAKATLRGQKRNTANDEPLQGAVRDRCVVALGMKSP